MNQPPNVGDIVRLKYRVADVPFLAVVTHIEPRVLDGKSDLYLSWTRQFADPSAWSAIGGFNPHAGSFGACMLSHVHVLHP